MMEVIYSNSKPQFQEMGPFVYKESNEYENLTYSDNLNFYGDELPIVNATYSQSVKFDSDSSGNIDTQMYLTN